ncbi:MAG: hypothetical protein JNJ95_06075 [Dechloromonas sp.]|nr:hypothetical protein [Dechloromonas sp.]
MNRLITELSRLYFLPGQEWQSWRDSDNGKRIYVEEGVLTTEVLAERLITESNVGLVLVSPSGMVRALVIGFENGGDWEQVAALYQAVQEELALPAPAISVSVEDGYQVWFSLAEPLPLQQAREFLSALRLSYLPEVSASRVLFRPGIEAHANDVSQRVLPLMQANKEPVERWSAFIDPRMGSMFIEEQWLEMAPNLDKQAAMLAGVESIAMDDFLRALNIMQAGPEMNPVRVEKESCSGGQLASSLGEPGRFNDPKDFLLAVMNDSHIGVGDRIEAAKALLPYFEGGTAK